MQLPDRTRSRPSLTVDSLTKRYGTVTAVDSLTFELEPGHVTGLVGPNGSGKSTTMRMILGLVTPTSGSVQIDGVEYAALERPMTHVGAVLSAEAVHPALTGRSHLRWLCAATGTPAERVGELLDLVGLSDVADRRFDTYSLGMRQRLGIATALLADPPILMFDEPMNGLDPDGMVWLRRFLRDRADEGRIVMLSSHLMGELEGLADQLVVIDRGRLVVKAPTAELLGAHSSAAVVVRTDQTMEVMVVLAAAGATVTSSAPDTVCVEGLPVTEVADAILRNGLRLHGLTDRQTSLEDVYLELTRTNRNGQ